MDILDSQAHVGPGGAGDLIAAMDALGIRSALLDEFWFGWPYEMPTYPVEAAGETIRRPRTPAAELAAFNHPERFAYVIRPDRRDPELASLIRQGRDSPHVRALRITPGLDRGEVSALAEGAYDGMFSAAADFGLPVFVTIPGNAASLRPIIEMYSAVTFVIDHCGMPFTPAMKAGLAAAGISNLPAMGGGSNDQEFAKVLGLADLPNAALKWGHAQGLFGVSGYPFEGLRPHLRNALDAFGPERVMWAGDASVNLTGESWAQLLFWIFADAGLSTAEVAGLLGGAARRILDWPAGGVT